MTNQQIEKAVSHPMHYNRGSIEVWDFIADWRFDYLRGNAVKYICRAGFKDDKEQDLRKALEYLKKALSNTTYPRQVGWVDYEPAFDPVAFAGDQQLDPPLAAAIVMITQWDISGAIHFVSLVLDDMLNDEAKHKPPVVYGTDEEKLTDTRSDKRVFEFGKRIGEDR